jgi:hypothetical protein
LNITYFLETGCYLTKSLEKYGTICSGKKKKLRQDNLLQGRKFTVVTFIKGDLAYAQGVF